MTRIAVLGGGVMGEALIDGFQRRLNPRPVIVVAEMRAERAAEFHFFAAAGMSEIAANPVR